MFNYDELENDYKYKLSVFKELDFKFNQEQLNYIHNFFMYYFNSSAELKNTIFQEKSFFFEKNLNESKLIIKFDSSEFYIFLNFMFFFFMKFYDATINVNSDSYVFTNKWEKTNDICCCEINNAYEKNKEFFINIRNYINNKNNSVVISFDDAESAEIAINLIFVDLYIDDLKKSNINEIDYFLHSAKKYIE